MCSASGGYPGKYETGYEIFGVEQAERVGAYVFHAGTGGIDKCVTAGGRVLGVTALGKTLEEAILRAYRHLRTYLSRICTTERILEGSLSSRI